MSETKYRTTWQAWIEAFTIFAKYEAMTLDTIVAEHDVIYAGPAPAKVSDEDKERLIVCGWKIDEHINRFYRYV